MKVDMVLTKECSLDKMLVTKIENSVGDHDGLDVDDHVERMLMTNLDKTDNIAQQSGAPAWHREGEGR